MEHHRRVFEAQWFNVGLLFGRPLLYFLRESIRHLETTCNTVGTTPSPVLRLLPSTYGPPALPLRLNERPEHIPALPWSAGPSTPRQLIVAAHLHLTLFSPVIFSHPALTLPPPSQLVSRSIVGSWIKIRNRRCCLLAAFKSPSCAFSLSFHLGFPSSLAPIDCDCPSAHTKSPHKHSPIVRVHSQSLFAVLATPFALGLSGDSLFPLWIPRQRSCHGS